MPPTTNSPNRKSSSRSCPRDALALAERFAPRLRDTVYVDCNAVNPKTVARIEAAITTSGAPFVDAGIIGLPSKPTVYCSGAAASSVLALQKYGLRVRQVRAASALKMSYAGITKGLIAVGSAMMLGAARAGTTDDLLSEMAETQPQLLALLRKMVPDMPPKAYRWVAEMEEIAGFLDGVPGGGALYHAIAELYRHLAAESPDGAEVQTLGKILREARPPGSAQNDS